MSKNDEYGLFLTAEEARDVREIVQSVREARAEKAKKKDELTKKDIMSIKDINVRQRLIKENMHLFK